MASGLEKALFNLLSHGRLLYCHVEPSNVSSCGNELRATSSPRCVFVSIMVIMPHHALRGRLFSFIDSLHAAGNRQETPRTNQSPDRNQSVLLAPTPRAVVGSRKKARILRADSRGHMIQSWDSRGYTISAIWHRPKKLLASEGKNWRKDAVARRTSRIAALDSLRDRPLLQ